MYKEKLLYYLSDDLALNQAIDDTGLDADEIEHLVGRFTKASQWAGKLRGKLCENQHGQLELRTSFGNKLLWRQDAAQVPLEQN